MNYILISAAVLTIGLALAWYFFFTIYEIKIITKPDKLVVNSKEQAVIKIVPVNLLGQKVPFRSIPFDYRIVENKDLVSIAKNQLSNNLLYVMSKNKTGKVKLEITSKYSLFPNIINISVIEQRN